MTLHGHEDGKDSAQERKRVTSFRPDVRDGAVGEVEDTLQLMPWHKPWVQLFADMEGDPVDLDQNQPLFVTYFRLISNNV